MWWDFFKLFSYAFEDDPLSKKAQQQQATGAGTSQPGAIPNVRGDGSFWGGSRGLVQLRDSNDHVDLSSISSRMSRYKEYERLRSVAEIEQAMTVFADESCISGDTKIATPFYGYKTIRWLTKHKKDEPFLVYCWDFDKDDFTLGWAYDPRIVKTAKTLKVLLDNGNSFVVTPDHRILLRNGQWIYAGSISEGDELMPFYKERAQQHLTEIKTNQFPRIFSFKEGWRHERQFIDEWRTGKEDKRYAKVNQACRLITQGATVRETAKIVGHDWPTIDKWMKKEGWSVKELKRLAAKRDRLRVIGVQEWNEMEVYDLSVKKHENFCTDTTVMHNCQRNDDGHVFKIDTDSDEIKKELEFLFFNRGMLNMDRQIWQLCKKLFIQGDLFLELVINPDAPKDGILKIAELPADSMYRIETTKGKIIEFHQSNEGPDLQALTRAEVTRATQAELQQNTAIRFTPNQIVHFRIGDDRKTFYPYGQSLIEPARGPAHQLRLMEDAMVVYRLCLAGDTRVRTKEGWKYIKDIKVGDDVFSYLSKEGKAIYSKVVNWENNGNQKTYKVRSKHIEITGNDKHPILVERDGKRQYVKIKDLIPKKDRLINVTRDEEIPVKIPTIFNKWAKLDWSQRTAFRNNEYENKSQLMRECSAELGRVKQFLYSENKALPYEQAIEICEKFDLDPSKLEIANKGQCNSDRINLPEYVDEEFARLFGFLIGDGSIRGGEIGYGNQLFFTGGTDKEQNEYYASLMKKFFNRVRFEKDKRSKLELGNYVVDSQIACRIMHAMGYINGAHNKRIPQWVFSAPKNIRRAFVEGISNADGCERYTKAGTWFSTIELCNEKLVADIKEVWHSIGLCSGKLGHRKRKGGHEIEPGRKMPPTECYKVTISDCTLPKTENIWSVEEEKEQDVFDLTVDHETHNFIANGCPVSNTRAPERRVFYIDVGQLAPFRAEAFIERMKDQFRKKKVATGKGGAGANAVEERWHAPAADEDYWLPIRPNSNTRIETLPGAQNLGEIDDALYFRNKLLTALGLPKNFFANDDPQATRITLSAQDVRFARMIERLQQHIEDGLLAIAERHLILRGFPEAAFDNMRIKMTPPSDWKELSRAEVVTNRINNANSLKGSLLLSDIDILTKWMQYSEDESEEMIARMKIQKLEDLKLQVMAQNPQLMGIGVPGDGETELGAEMGGPNPMLGPEGQPPPGPEGGMPPMGGEQGGGLEGPPPAEGGASMPAPNQQPQPAGGGAAATTLPEPEQEYIKKYDLEIEDYASQVDEEEIDYSEFD